MFGAARQMLKAALKARLPGLGVRPARSLYAKARDCLRARRAGT